MLPIALLLLQIAAATDPPEWYKWFAQLGVGGVLAGLMFFFYRQDRKASEERHAKCEERLELAFKETRAIVQDNTQAMTRLVDVIERK